MSEDKILAELIEDRKIIAKEAKKTAMKEISRLQKTGRGCINEDLDFDCEMTPTSSHNRWMVMVVVNVTQNPKWFHRAACIVESEHGNRDLYILRGLSIKKPYFVKVSWHALKRLKERLMERCLGDDSPHSMEWMGISIFQRGEIVPWMKITDPRFLKITLESDDRHLMTTLFYTYWGCYLGYETRYGNYEFKTFLNKGEERKKNEESLVQLMCHIAHVMLNKKLYKKEYVEKFSNEKFPMTQDMVNVMNDFKDKYILLP